MATITPPAPAEITPKGTNRVLVIAAVIVLVAVVALAGWVLVDRYLLESDVEAFLDDYAAAWEAGDGEAVVAMFRTGGTWVNTDGTAYEGDELATFVDGFAGFDFSYESIGRPVVIEEKTASGANYLVSDRHIISFDQIVGEERSTFESEGFSVYYLAEQDGEFEIMDHYWYSTP